MQYTVGQQLRWTRDLSYEPECVVEVVALRRGGRAKLSNGWVVDEDGIADGTNRVAGGRVFAVDEKPVGA